MTDDQETRWWQAVDDGTRFFVHGLMVLLTWSIWLLGKLAQRHTTAITEDTPTNA